MRILIVEDDPALSTLLRKGLTAEGHTVDEARTGLDGLEYGLTGAFDGIILDLMLPGIDGLEVARRLRRDGITTPILMLTARTSLDDRLSGFEAGADDYLAKPFAFAELLARLRAITRRGSQIADEQQLTVGDLVLDRAAHEVTRAGKPITLAPKEYALLEYLMEHPGQVLSRTLILERVWDYGFDSFANVVDVTIRRLRKAVDDGFEQPLIQTVRGAGYKIKA